ncbi:bifunctional DNA primase/polymerase [Streptomyces sp. NPDC101152]|uniref:bifunctional DNA primase/polymerase n=1 Tax=Streptomyces sp. NPDC101152 TaxID=3366116 RepID=UPI003821949E
MNDEQQVAESVTAEGAVRLAERGFAVFSADHPSLPQCSGIGKWHDPATCEQRGKHPSVKFTTEYTTDPDEIRRQLTRRPQNYGVYVGACRGPANARLFVVDSDRPGAIEDVAKARGETWLTTMRVLTAKGYHDYVWGPADLDLGNGLGALKGEFDGDVRAGNAYVIGPGSVHQTGVIYTLENPEQAPVHAPAWLLDALTARPKATFVPVAGITVSMDRLDAYTRKVVQDECDAITYAPDGDQNNTINTAAFNLGTLVGAGAISEGEARQHLLAAARAGNHPEGRAAGAVASGLGAGMAQPRHPWPPVGRAKDISDHFAAGRTLDDPVFATAPEAAQEPEAEHGQAPDLRTEEEREEYDRAPKIVFRKASSFTLKKTEWLWDTTKPGAIPHTEGRIPKAMLSVAAGLPGTGKSQYAIWLTSQITRGTLPGCFYGQPKNVIYAATEDDWERTIAPRLVAAGADLDCVLCVAVRTIESGNIKLNVAVHHDALGKFAMDNDVALAVFDPLLSHIGGDINPNAESEVRAALEPLVKTAAKAGLTVLGLSHFNKGSSTDPMERLMGSRGFSALLRALIVFSRDKDAEEEGPARFVLSQAKSNLGRTDIPSYSYTLANTVVQLEDGDETHVPRFVLGPESGTSVEKQLEQVGQTSIDVEIGKDCVKWLRAYLMNAGGEADLADIKKAYKSLDFSQPAVYRARKALGIKGETTGLAGHQVTVWRLPEELK